MGEHPLFACSRRILPSPAEAGFKPPHYRLLRKKDNRGLRPRGTLYFLAAKSTKNSPADASAYFVPSNVRNGRLFAGLQANRPRFLPLLAGPSFHGSGIGPGSFAAKRGGRDASGTSRKHRSLRSPLEAGFNRRILAWSGRRTTDSPRARSGRLHSLVLAAPAQRGPEVVPAKATCGWFWCYLLPPKGSYTPRHSPRFCLFGRTKKRTREQRVFVPVRMFAVSSGRRPQVGRPDGASTKILRTFASRKKRI